MKKDMIERECQGLLEFLESPFTLDNVAGHDAVKAWLREDAELLRRGVLNALPMGYLITGRIGTGKTFLVQCWAGELGIPCVVFKNFRDHWVGATESNLEKIFSILRALGQVVVFVDEADQAAGKREGGERRQRPLRPGLRACWRRRCPRRATAGGSSGSSPPRGRTCSRSISSARAGSTCTSRSFRPQTAQEAGTAARGREEAASSRCAEPTCRRFPDDVVLGGNEIEGRRWCAPCGCTSCRPSPGGR